MVLKVSCGVSSVDLMAGTQAIKTLRQVLMQKKFVFRDVLMHLVCRLDLPKLWTCLRMFSHVCFRTKKRSCSLTSHTNAGIHFYMSKFKHCNYRYLVPLLTSSSQFCSVHIYGDWLLDMANKTIIYIHVLHGINTDTQVAFP